MRAITRYPLAAAALAASLLLGGCASDGAHAEDVVEYQADYADFASLEEAVAASGAVVTGSVVASRTVEVFPDAPTGDDPVANPQAGVKGKDVAKIPGVVTTVLTVEVSEVLAGDVAVGDRIEVSQLGGTVDGVTYRERHTTALADGGSYLLLLADHGPGVPYDVINPAQGIYTVSGDAATAVSPEGFADVSLSSVSRLTE